MKNISLQLASIQQTQSRQWEKLNALETRMDVNDAVATEKARNWSVASSVLTAILIGLVLMIMELVIKPKWAKPPPTMPPISTPATP